jgi:hypothetical protein
MFKKFMRAMLAVACVMACGSVFAETNSAAFDAAGVIATATETVQGINTGVSTLLGFAILLAAGFLGYRKISHALAKA